MPFPDPSTRNVQYLQFARLIINLARSLEKVVPPNWKFRNVHHVVVLIHRMQAEALNRYLAQHPKLAQATLRATSPRSDHEKTLQPRLQQ